MRQDDCWKPLGSRPWRQSQIGRDHRSGGSRISHRLHGSEASLRQLRASIQNFPEGFGRPVEQQIAARIAVASGEKQEPVAILASANEINEWKVRQSLRQGRSKFLEVIVEIDDVSPVVGIGIADDLPTVAEADDVVDIHAGVGGDEVSRKTVVELDPVQSEAAVQFLKSVK